MITEWIRIRVFLHDNPRVIQMARILREHAQFRSWLGSGDVSPAAMRSAICGLLVRVWGTAREHGRFEGQDLVMAGLQADDLDAISGAPGFGSAMLAVGWAFVRPDLSALVLPKFAEHNTAKTPAERMRLYRLRQKEDCSATREREEEEEEEEEEAADAASAAGSQASPPAPSAAIDQVVMMFPCTKAAKGKYKGLDQWPLTASKLAEYRASFPAVNLDLELKKARQWLIDNNRKTYKGTPAYLSRWLGKAQDQAPGRGGTRPGGKRTSTEFLQQQARSLFDETGELHAGDPNDE